MKRVVAALAFLLLPSLAFAADDLRIVSAGPVGLLSSMGEANEIRVVFSEPMVVLGRIPSPVTAPFFRMDPKVKGTFRWSGTTTLIFTPDQALDFASEYAVVIDKSVKAVSGKTLDENYRWTFITPVIRLLNTGWYRKAGKYDGPIVIGLRFNQPVDAQTIVSHLKLSTATHTLSEVDIPEEGKARLKPAELQAFEAKKATAEAAASSDGQPVLAFLATDWNVERFPKGNDLVVLETKPGIAPDTWINVLLDDKLAQSPRNARSGPQSYTIELDPSLFLTEIGCRAECDPDWRNALTFRSNSGIPFVNILKAVTITDITDPKNETVVKPKKVSNTYEYPSTSYGFDELGYSLLPARKYAVRVDPSLAAEDGQKLGYTWMAEIENWHRSAFVSFGSGHGVWEASGGPVLPFHARNYRNVQQWLAPLKLEDLMPAMLKLRESGFTLAPPNATPQTRKLNLAADKIASLGLDLAPAIGSDNMGLVWAAVQPGESMAHSRTYDDSIRATLVQATNLGISVKDSPQNTVILVTRLDDAKPVEGAKVSIRDKANKIFWSGTTDAKGLAVALNTDLRRDKNENLEEWEVSWRALSELNFVVIAEKDGDVGYVGSDWNEGVTPWDFGTRYDVNEADAQLRGMIFVDRGVYKLGEEVHFKSIVRADMPDGMKLVPAGTNIEIRIVDSQNQEVDKRSVPLNAWSSTEWTLKLPQEAPLGTYSVYGSVPGHRGSIYGNFLVAAYRRPEFRVDVTLNSNNSVAGSKLNGTITGKYLFGAAMSGKPVSWTYSKEKSSDVPSKITDRFPSDRFTFLGYEYTGDDSEEESYEGVVTISQGEGVLDAKGDLKLKLDTEEAAGSPYTYNLEGIVTDVTRQQIAGRASSRVDPAPWYIGIKDPPYFAEAAKGIDTEIVAAGLDGLAVPGVEVKVELKRLQWTSVRKAEGGGFYEWETERKEVPAGEWTITSEAQPVPLHIPLTEGGQYVLRARADEKGSKRFTTTTVWFYAIGEGYTAWERYDHNRIDLIPEKETYRPGETARIMVKSPWESATALLTTEREGVRTWTQFELTSTQQTITVPISEKEIPNFYVSVLILKGRTKKDPDKDGSDPGKPAFRLGYVELKVEDATKRLAVDVKANRDEFRPASKAKIDVNVKDAKGKPAQAEVTLWAVDYGVLSLTGYKTPDVLERIYLNKALQVANGDSRQRIVSRRVLTPKGGGEGGGGGRDAGPGMLRRDFRVLAFWLGSLVTDAKGRAHTEITLPESLTTYRIMAVAGDKQSRFGNAQAEVKINKPLMLTASWPRFLAVGDKASFGGVVHNQTKNAGKATVTIESLDPNVITVSGGQTILSVQPGSSTEVRFDAEAKSAGNARIRMRVTMARENDAFEDIIPVRVLVSPETVAAYGEANPRAEEKVEIPADVVPGFGGLRVDLSSTAMIGLAEGAQYLVEYPYGCAEQRSSRALGLMLITDLGGAFQLPGIEPAKQKEAVQTNLDELKRFQCGDGGFAFWPGHCYGPSSPYLSSYVMHVFQRGKSLGYSVDDPMLQRAYTFLDGTLSQPPPPNEGWRPGFNAWQAFAIKVLAEGGRNVDSHLNRVYEYRERMPVFGLTHLLDAMIVKKETGARPADLKRRIMNSILPEGGHAFVNELKDPYLLWFWNSNVRSTAMALGTLVRHGSEEEIVKRMVRWLMKVREDGRWGNTQENAWAMEALVDYYRKYEAEVPDFLAKVALGNETLATETFKGRSTQAVTKEFSMRQLLAKAPAGQQLPAVFTREGTGTLFYMMRLRYAANVLRYQPMDQGFRVERWYTLQNGEGQGTKFKAGDLIQVTIRIRNTKERRYVAITDPIPAGTEPVETWFATTASQLAQTQSTQEASSWYDWWERGGFDYVERHDDRVNLFATRLGEGTHEFSYLVRATTAGTFVTAPTHAEEMYEPEVFGRNGTVTVEVQK